MLAPRKVKYRKPQKGRMKGMSVRGSHVAFGTFGLKALEPGWITSRQIEAAVLFYLEVLQKSRESMD